MSPVSVACCQVEVSAMGLSLVQRSYTVCVCVCMCVCARVCVRALTTVTIIIRPMLFIPAGMYISHFFTNCNAYFSCTAMRNDSQLDCTVSCSLREFNVLSRKGY